MLSSNFFNCFCLHGTSLCRLSPSDILDSFRLIFCYVFLIYTVAFIVKLIRTTPMQLLSDYMAQATSSLVEFSTWPQFHCSFHVFVCCLPRYWISPNRILKLEIRVTEFTTLFRDLHCDSDWLVFKGGSSGKASMLLLLLQDSLSTSQIRK